MNYTTELSAVNSMLATIGEAPLNSLETSGLPDAVMALSTLQEVTREVLVQGWKFNTEEEYPLVPSALSPYEIKVPRNILSCLPDEGEVDIVVRGQRLYNLTDRTYSFKGTEEVTCTVILSMDFSDLPEVTKQYITVRAGRIFQSRVVGAQVLYALTKDQERRALWAHKKSETRARRKNLMSGTFSNSILSR